VDRAGNVYVTDVNNNRVQKFAPVGTTPVVIVPGGSAVPQDLNHDGLYEDVDGNGVLDFEDVVLFFNQMDWIADNEPVAAFDFNRNGQIDFNDIVILFNEL
jgi:PKD repeat protein